MWNEGPALLGLALPQLRGDAFRTEVLYAASRAGVEASLLVQLRESRFHPSLRQAIPLVADPLSGSVVYMSF